MSDPTETDETGPDAGGESEFPKAILEEYLDEYDYRIFELLNRDGRISDTELAEAVGLSRTAVRRRRENLVEDGMLEIIGVISFPGTDLAYADLRISLRTEARVEERDRLVRKFVDADLVYSVDSVLGDHDLLVRGWHSSLGDLKSYFWELLDDESAIADYDITVVTDTWKAWNRELKRPETE